MNKITSTINKLGLSIESKFVPFSQSRNKAEKSPSLNWKVTLKKDGKDILTTDYMAGCGHCPSYKQNDNSYDTRQLINLECESGYKARQMWSMGHILPDKKSPILPKIEDVIYSLVMDSEVLDFDFSDWCANFGYSEDSRKDEKTYNDCMQIALKINRTLGTDGINTLREVYQDY